MYLIRVSDLQLKEFIPELSPPYAILSHRWDTEEVSFQDMKHLHKARGKKGFRKIRKTCQQAADDGLKYAWVDTCCIDKKSSAELSEAINSMFKWYAKAKVCYVFMSDVQSSPLQESEFASSTWFTRGWTLQELIAPKHLIFYSAAWNPLGKKKKLTELLQKITGIDRDVLTGVVTDLSAVHISERMSWAAKRSTTRLEDEAYSLMGIFDVNMPLLYGEGQKAFLRLQEEIIKRTTDLSILAWQTTGPIVSGLLAPSVAYFSGVPRLIQIVHSRSEPKGLLMTPGGLSLEVRMLPWSPGIFIGITDYMIAPNSVDDYDGYPRITIFLCQVQRRSHVIWRRFHGISIAQPANTVGGINKITLVPRAGSQVREGRVLVVPQLSSDDRDARLCTGFGDIQLENVLCTTNHMSLDIPSSFFAMSSSDPCVVKEEIRNLNNIEVKFGTCGPICIIDPQGSIPPITCIILGIDYDGLPFLLATTQQTRIDNTKLFEDAAVVKGGHDMTSEWKDARLHLLEIRWWGTNEFAPNSRGIWALTNMCGYTVALVAPPRNENDQWTKVANITMNRLADQGYKIHARIEAVNSSQGLEHTYNKHK